jgi:hypothetical protein
LILDGLSADEVRYALRVVHGRTFALLPGIESDSQHGCGRQLRPNTDAELYSSADGERVYAYGLKTCGSVWSCPVCSSRICYHRGEELQAAIDGHVCAGGDVLLFTGTLPHHAGHSLYQVTEAVNEAWTYLRSGNPWRRWADRIGYLGAVRGIEATHGRNGWHAHVHAVLFLDRVADPRELVRFRRWCRKRWARKIKSYLRAPLERGPDGTPRLARERAGSDVPLRDQLFGEPGRRYGVRISRGEHAGHYIAKMGLGKEAVRMEVKRGRGGNRTAWEILRDYAEREDPHDAALWIEWCRTMKGRAHLVWSPHLRERIGTAQLDLFTDAELAAEPEPEEEDTLELVVDRTLWWAVESRVHDPVSWFSYWIRGGATGEEVARACEVLCSDMPRPGQVRHDPTSKRLWIV